MAHPCTRVSEGGGDALLVGRLVGNPLYRQRVLYKLSTWPVSGKVGFECGLGSRRSICHVIGIQRANDLFRMCLGT